MRNSILAIIALLCMGGSLPSTRWQAIDNNGNPVVGAKLYFYEAGTTTPTDTYPTQADQQAATNANANPVISQAGGWFPEIFLQTDQAYKVKYTDASDTQIWVIDNIDATALTDVLGTRLKQIASNPLDYGGAGDGVTDDCGSGTPLQDAIDNATGVVDLLGKTYVCNSQITLTSGITLRNGTLDFSSSTSNDYIKVWGSLGSPVGINGDIAYADTTFAVDSASGLAAGDWLYLYSTDIWIGAATRGELVHIESLSGTTITPVDPVRDAYTEVAGSGSIREITMISDVVLEDLEIIASESGSNDSVISLDLCENISIRNVEVDTFDAYGVQVDSCANVLVTDSTFRNGNDDANSSGVVIGGPTLGITVADSMFQQVYNGVEVDDANGREGITRDVTIHSNTFSGSMPIFSNSSQAEHVVITGNTILGTNLNGHGILVTYPNAYIANNFVQNVDGTGDCINIEPDIPNVSGRGFNFTVTGNSCRAGDIQVTSTITGTGDIDAVTIANNAVASDIILEITSGAAASQINRASINGNQLPAAAIQFAGGDTDSLNNLTIADNVAVNIVGAGAAANMINQVVVSGNVLSCASIAKCMDIDTVTRLSIIGNHITGDGTNTTHGMEITNPSQYVHINDNVVDNVITSYGIYVGEIPAGSISGNTVQMASGSGIYVVNASTAVTGLTVVGNHVTAADHGVYYEPGANTTHGLVIAGNYAKTSTTSANEHALYINSSTDTTYSVSGNYLQRANDTDTTAEVTIGAEGGIFTNNFLFNGSAGVNFTQGDSTGVWNNWAYSISSPVVTATTDIDLYGGDGPTGTCVHSVANLGGVLTLAPECGLVMIDCDAAGTCDITMDESADKIAHGQIVDICNDDTDAGGHVCDFADTSNVTELAGAFAAGPWDCIRLRYTGSRWVEVSRSNN